MNKGMWYALAAFVAWGLLPVYWKWLHVVAPMQVLSHRIVWSFVMLAAGIVAARQWNAFRGAALDMRALRIYLIAAALISVNWLTYIWAVSAGFIVETSLGYFINPLLSILLGVLILHERLRPLQWLPIALAAAGVLYLTFAYGSLPWIGLTLAFSFGTYGLVKKKAPLGSVYGMAMETGILFVPALLFLLYSEFSGQGAFLHDGGVTDLLLVGAGLVTTAPLLLFASAAHHVPLSAIGVMQFINPTLQFLIGVLVYLEPFTLQKGIGFGIVWLALIIFLAEGFLARRTQAEALPADFSE